MKYTPKPSVSEKKCDSKFTLNDKRLVRSKLCVILNTISAYQHMSEVCLCMFQMPLHFNRTGVRVVAMCPATTDTSMARKGAVFFDKEWNTLVDGWTFQP